MLNIILSIFVFNLKTLWAGQCGGINAVLFLPDLDYYDECKLTEIPCLHIPIITKVTGGIDENNPNDDGNKQLEENLAGLKHTACKKYNMVIGSVTVTSQKCDKKRHKQHLYDYNIEELNKIPAIINDQTKHFIGDEGYLEKTQRDVNSDTYDNKENYEYQEKGLVENEKSKREIKRVNTQVFELDPAIMEDLKEDPKEAGPHYVRSTNNKNMWDVLGVVAALKKSYFYNQLKPDVQQRVVDDEKCITCGGCDSIGKVPDVGLLSLVKKSLCSLKENMETLCKSGYLLIVKGGCVSDLLDPYSDLVQAIKHVAESCDSANTLLVVSGKIPLVSCSERCKYRSVTIPVFAKGPSSKQLCNARGLGDVPQQICQVLGKNIRVPHRISKRNSDINLYIDDSEENNKNEVLDPINDILEENNEVVRVARSGSSNFIKKLKINNGVQMSRAWH